MLACTTPSDRDDGGAFADVDACTERDGGEGARDGGCASTEPRPYAAWPDPLVALTRGREHTEEVCARGGDDPVRDAFCAAAPAKITSLHDLYDALAVHEQRVPTGHTGLALTAHSTGLSIRSVSAINPRVFSVRLEVPGAIELLAIAFVRGEQLVELVVRDRADADLRFYLVGFTQACNERERGCLPGDLLTPAVESSWRDVTLYDETDVRNTVLDCAPCHQPDGPSEKRTLRMQERASPWTHWMFRASEGGRVLLADYFSTHGDELLAGYTAQQIEQAHPGNVAMLADFAGFPEPNPFDSAAIEDEVRASSEAEGGAQPFDNRVPGESATWQEAYERSLRGEVIPVPYHDVKVTDPDKLARMRMAYQAYRAGELDADALPDIRDVYPDDPRELARMGMMTEPGAGGAQVLLQACSQCHNPRLDPDVSRASFRADLEGMTRAEKDIAIERMKLPEDHPLAMPPSRVRRLSAEARRRAIELLKR